MWHSNHTAVRVALGQPTQPFHSVSPACPDPSLSLSNSDSTNAHILGVAAIRFFCCLEIHISFYFFLIFIIYSNIDHLKNLY